MCMSSVARLMTRRRRRRRALCRLRPLCRSVVEAMAVRQLRPLCRSELMAVKRLGML